MTFWGNFAIFETTAKNSVLERWVAGTHLQYEKKMKKFDLIKSCPKIEKFRYFGENFELHVLLAEQKVDQTITPS